MILSACEQMADLADEIAADHPTYDGRELLVELGVRVAGIVRGPLAAVVLLTGGRNRLRGGGFRTGLRDRSAGQARHFVGVARAVTILGATRTVWISEHVRRDARDSPDGRLTLVAVDLATGLLDGSLAPADAGDWIRNHVCGRPHLG